MKTNIFFSILILSTACVIVSCDNDSRVDDMNVVEYADPDENEQPLNESENHHDSDYKSFAMNAFSEGLMEIELANVALEKSENSDVRELAQLLKTEYSQTNKSLQKIMQNNTWDVSEKMTDNDTTNIKQISTMPEGKFDTHYLRIVANNHEKAIALFQDFTERPEKSDSVYSHQNTLPGDRSQNITHSKDNYYPNLNSWAEATLTKLKAHLKKIEEVQLQIQEKVQ